MRLKVLSGYRICLFILIMCFSYTCFSDTSNKPQLELPLQDMRLVAYTANFAKRFNLPEIDKPADLGNGIEAIEFAVEKEPFFSGLYSCVFYIYFNSHLDIKLPESGASGSRHILSVKNHFFIRQKEAIYKINEEDRSHINRARIKYNRKANLATIDYSGEGSGKIAGLVYSEFYENIFPKLSYIKLTAPPITIPSIASNDNDEIKILIQKNISTEYLKKLNINEEDFFNILIPKKFTKKMREWSANAHSNNMEIINRDK